MKKVVTIICLTIITILLFAAYSSAYADMVEYHGVVAGINYVDDTFTVVTDDGNIWEMEEIEDWMLADTVYMVVDDMGTASIKDDEVDICWYRGAMDMIDFYHYLDNVGL